MKISLVNVFLLVDIRNFIFSEKIILVVKEVILILIWL